MDKKLIFLGITIIIIISIFILAWQFIFPDLFTAREYNNQPINKCFNDPAGFSGSYRANIFKKVCSIRDGVIRTEDMHPDCCALYCCYQKAPDVGKECSLGKDCLSGVCHLDEAITSGRCSLVKKEMLKDFLGYPNTDERFYTATYTCNTRTPGVCAEAIDDYHNPGGKSHHYEMDGQTLIEIFEPGPIS